MIVKAAVLKYCRFLIGFSKEVSAEEGSDAPKAGKADDRINDPGDQCPLTAEEPRNEIKLKQTDKSPIDRADDG